MKKMTCRQARTIDLVNYLAGLGYQPKKIRNNDYWYKSPFRDERTPSFKVNRKLNAWYDFGEGKGGDLVAFGTRYFHCSISDLLQRLNGLVAVNDLSFYSAPRLVTEKRETNEGKIQVISERRLSSKILLSYLKQRKIPVTVARHFCLEADFLLYNKKHTAIGFKNDAGGFELRSHEFKISSSPKTVTFIDNLEQRLIVFEGFFNFLSFHAIQRSKSKPVITLPGSEANFLVLNSLAFFRKSRDIMEQHRQVYLFLDRDKAGSKATAEALEWSPCYIDKSYLYRSFKDLNECLVKK